MGVDTKVAGYPVHRVVSFSASITQNGVTIRRIDWISHKASLCGRTVLAFIEDVEELERRAAERKDAA